MNLNMMQCHLKHLTDEESLELLESVTKEVKKRNLTKIPELDVKSKEEAKELIANLFSALLENQSKKST